MNDDRPPAGFLARWSRRKRGEDRDEPVPGIAVPAETESAGPEPEMTAEALDELIATLPRIEDLAPGQDLAAFFQSWVPKPLQNAALRRMWAIDPAIRDFVSEALDYAYDYNAPGGAPGYGPMIHGVEAVKTALDWVGRVSGDGTEDTDESRHFAAAEPDTETGSVEAVTTRIETTAPIGTGDDLASEPELPPPSVSVARRHGGALPT